MKPKQLNLSKKGEWNPSLKILIGLNVPSGEERKPRILLKNGRLREGRNIGKSSDTVIHSDCQFCTVDTDTLQVLKICVKNWKHSFTPEGTCLSITALLRISLRCVTSAPMHSAGAFTNLCVQNGHNCPRGLRRYPRYPSGTFASCKFLLDPGYSSNPIRSSWLYTCLTDSRCRIRWIGYRHCWVISCPHRGHP